MKISVQLFNFEQLQGTGAVVLTKKRLLFIGVHSLIGRYFFWHLTFRSSYGHRLYDSITVSVITVRLNNIYLLWKRVSSPENTNVFVSDVVVGLQREAYSTRPKGSLGIRRNFAHRRNINLHIYTFAFEALARIH